MQLKFTQLRISSVCLLIAVVCSILVAWQRSANAQQLLDSSGRYTCQSRKIVDGSTKKVVALSALTKATNRKIATLTKKLKATPKKNKTAIARLKSQIAELRTFLARAKSCVAGTLPVPPTATPSGPTATPTRTPTPGVPVPHVEVGYYHSCTASASGLVRCFGDNNSKQLGIGSGAGSATPLVPTGFSEVVVKSAAGGGRHSCAAPVSGGVFCWGENLNKQATGAPGDGISQADPGAVSGLTGEFVQVVGGDKHTCAVRKNGSVVCWGQNDSGECGVGSTSSIQPPTAVVGLATTVTKISSFNRHTCAVLGNGSVQCWGLNAQYPLGTGDFAIRTSATTPNNLRAGVSVVDVATGNDHTCIVYRDGMVQCVGQNDFGQMGQGSTSLSQTSFITVPLSAASAVAAGDDFTCAIVNLRTGVSCWGKGTSGQLGHGLFANSSSPVAVQGLSGTIVGIAAGEKFACALNSQGAVRCWGDNSSNQLGSLGGSSAVAILVDGLNLND